MEYEVKGSLMRNPGDLSHLWLMFLMLRNLPISSIMRISLYKRVCTLIVFQFGPGGEECASNYLEISDIQQQQQSGSAGEAWRARYCGNVGFFFPFVIIINISSPF